MHLYLQFNGKFTPKADRIARVFTDRYGCGRHSGIAVGEGHARWLLDRRHTPLHYEHVQALPELWRRALARGKADRRRIAELERDYGNLWRFIIADRNLGYRYYGDVLLPHTALRQACRSHDAILSCLQELFDYYERAFAELRPDLVLFHLVASAPGAVAAAVAHRCGIPFLALQASQIGDRFFVASNALMQPDEAVELYARESLPVSPEVARWYDEMREKRVAAIELARGGEAFKALYRNSRPALFWRHARGLPAALRRRRKPYPPDPREPTPLHRWRAANAADWTRFALFRAGFFEPGPPAGEFVYFPLAVTPEQSTCLVKPLYVDQSHLVDLLAQSVPAAWRVAVKEHLPMAGLRSVEFYRRLQRLPNVALIDPRSSPVELTRRAQAVVSVGGASVWEAAMAGRPALTFGRTWCGTTGLVHHTANPEALGDELRQCIRANAAVTPEDRAQRLRRMLEALHRASFPIDFRVAWETMTPAELDQSQAETDRIAERVWQRYQSLRQTGPWPDPFATAPWSRDRTPAAQEGPAADAAGRSGGAGSPGGPTAIERQVRPGEE